METPQVICSNPSLEFLLLENVLCREQLYLLGTGTTHSQTLPTTASDSLSSEKGLPALPLHLECPQPPSEPAVGKSINNSFLKCKCLLLSGTVLRTWHVLTHSILTKQTNKQTNLRERNRPWSPFYRGANSGTGKQTSSSYSEVPGLNPGRLPPKRELFKTMAIHCTSLYYLYTR